MEPQKVPQRSLSQRSFGQPTNGFISGIIILHVTQKETFELPNSRQWEFLIINGLIGTVVSELLWLWGCFLTSSLVRKSPMGLIFGIGDRLYFYWNSSRFKFRLFETRKKKKNNELYLEIWSVIDSQIKLAPYRSG